MCTDSADKNDSSEVSVDDDTKEDISAESTGEAGDSGEEDAPVVEVAEESYVPQASIEELEAESSKEAQNDDSTEQTEDDSKEETTDSEKGTVDDGDSNETANADDQAEAGMFNHILM